MIRNLLRETSLPNEIQKMIIRKTEGNPFFIEEIIRSFIDEGIIEVKDGHFIVTEKINNVTNYKYNFTELDFNNSEQCNGNCE